MTDWTPSKWFAELPFVVERPIDWHFVEMMRQGGDGFLVDGVPVEDWLAAFPLDRLH